MKIEFREDKNSSGFELIPESAEYAAKLMRISVNSKVAPAQITMYFDSEIPKTYIHIYKRRSISQRHYLTPTSLK